MPPKRAPRSGGASSAGASSSRTPPEPVDSALELVLQEEAGPPSAEPTRKRRRTLEDGVTKSLKDNFQSWGPEMTDELIIAGRSLRQQLLYDRQLVAAKDPKAPVIGKLYYEQMRDRYMPQSSPIKRLKAVDKNEVPHESLEIALMGFNQHIKKYDALLDFLETGPMVNQLSLVLLLKHCMKVSPKSGCDGLNWPREVANSSGPLIWTTLLRLTGSLRCIEAWCSFRVP